MKHRLAYAMAAFALVVGLASAGTATITEAGARNVGSSAAYVATCEKEQLLPTGTLADLLAELQQGLTPEHWVKVKKQYQASLHEKRQYSISKDQWVPFRITTENCTDLGKALPILKSAIRRNSK
jgi:S-adenosylmethionine:diacylglycerol 3-amino-3-carboxypropyl transferase